MPKQCGLEEPRCYEDLLEEEVSVCVVMQCTAPYDASRQVCCV